MPRVLREIVSKAQRRNNNHCRSSIVFLVFLYGWFDSYGRVLFDKNALGAGADIPREVAILHDH